MKNKPAWYTEDVWYAARNFVASCVDSMELFEEALYREGVVPVTENSTEEECLEHHHQCHSISERIADEEADAYILTAVAEGVRPEDLERFFIKLGQILIADEYKWMFRETPVSEIQ